MLCWPDEHRPALANVPAALQQRSFDELTAQLASSGINITGERDGAFVMNLDELPVKSGSLSQARTNLYAALDSLNIAAVSLSPSDVIALLGRNPLAWGVARGLESNIPGVANLLRSITPEEIFSRLDEATTYVLNDRVDETAEHGPWLASQFRQAAAADLRANGMLDDANESYRDFLDPQPERVVPELPEEYRTSPKPWQSPFMEE